MGPGVGGGRGWGSPLGAQPQTGGGRGSWIRYFHALQRSLLTCQPLTTQFPVLHFIILYVKFFMIKSQPASALQSSPALLGKPGAGETALGVKSGQWPTMFLTLHCHP